PHPWFLKGCRFKFHSTQLTTTTTIHPAPVSALPRLSLFPYFIASLLLASLNCPNLDRSKLLPLHHHRQTRWRRHGRCLQGRRHPPPSLRRTQIPPRKRRHRSANARPFPARSASRLRPQSRQHLHHLRHRRNRRPRLHRHGISRRPNAKTPHQQSPRRDRSTPRHRHSNRRRPRRRSLRRHRPSRHQPRQHLHHPPRPRQNSRLRPRQTSQRQRKTKQHL